jgi:hypothetical protein
MSVCPNRYGTFSRGDEKAKVLSNGSDCMVTCQLVGARLLSVEMSVRNRVPSNRP